MGIRETLNKSPGLTNGITVGIIVVALIAIIWQMHSSRPTFGIPKQFFTTDDGATWFTDENTNIAPFQHDGKDAVIAHVYKCGSKTFVGYLERFDPPVAAKLKTDTTHANDPIYREGLAATAMQVKLPGATAKWVPINSADGAKVMQVKCPGGSGTPDAVIAGME